MFYNSLVMIQPIRAQRSQQIFILNKLKETSFYKTVRYKTKISEKNRVNQLIVKGTENPLFIKETNIWTNFTYRLTITSTLTDDITDDVTAKCGESVGEIQHQTRHFGTNFDWKEQKWVYYTEFIDTC